MAPAAAPGNGTGVARRRRQQAQRASCRHVSWLLGLVQAKQAHHTAPTKVVETNVVEVVAALLKRIDGLENQVLRLLSQKEEHKAEEEEAASPVDIKQNVVAVEKVPATETTEPEEEKPADNHAPMEVDSSVAKEGKAEDNTFLQSQTTEIPCQGQSEQSARRTELSLEEQWEERDRCAVAVLCQLEERELGRKLSPEELDRRLVDFKLGCERLQREEE